VNAPARISLPRDAYIPAVTRLMPSVHGDELSLRCSLMLMRDQASSALRRCTEDAFGLLTALEALATRYVFQEMTVDELKQVRWMLVSLTATASSVNGFALGRLAPPAGGENANDG
jgi:hypothetical protein